MSNIYCTKDCKHKSYCKLDEEKTLHCQVVAENDGLIFGMTFDEINKIQHTEQS